MGAVPLGAVGVGEVIAQTVPAVPAQPPDELKPRCAVAVVTSVLPGLPLLGPQRVGGGDVVQVERISCRRVDQPRRP